MLARTYTSIGITVLMTAVMAGAFAQTGPAQAPTNQTARVDGTVAAVSGQTVTVKGAQGTVQFNVGPQTRIMARNPAKLSDINANTYLGTTAVEKNGRLESTEIHIFPESMRGAGDGHRPMQAPNTTMTNGNVVTTMTNGAVASIANGGIMKVAYQGGEKEIYVPAGVEITIIEPLDVAALKPGTRLNGQVQQNPDGTATGTIITVVR